MIVLLLISALAFAQATAILMVTATLVDSREIDSSRYPTSINGIPVSTWTITDDLARPCDACPWVLDADIPGYDWSAYPPITPDAPREPAPPFELKLPDKPPVQDPPPTTSTPLVM